MHDFVYYTPTRVFFGKNAEENIGRELESFGATKVLVHFGGGSARRSGLLDKVEKQLQDAGLPYAELGGVEPNPKIGKVREGIDFCKKEGVDFILAVGGGSVLDSSKAIALGLEQGGDPWEMFMTGKIPDKRIPIGAVITISAAGSEMSNSCVISNPDEHLKRSLNSDINRPQVAFMNPENTFTVSPYQTACGVVDIMMHTLERYFCDSPTAEPTDSIAEAVLTSTIDAGRRAMADPEDYDARATLMWCSSLSHNNLTGVGRNFWFVCHKLEHDISGWFDNVAHGAGLAVVFPAWAKYEYKNDPKRFARFARKVWGVVNDDDEAAALEGIEKTKSFFRELGMPVTMAELGVTPDWYEKIASYTTDFDKKTIVSYTPLNTERIMEIYRLAE
ncbi:MAG: iron-containing alcohol dehydrogenase [Oscillospiraceae bacterium]|nr:iron-containing alcohol dehydrogenase [Oscillospiraceae bacterium]